MSGNGGERGCFSQGKKGCMWRLSFCRISRNTRRTVPYWHNPLRMVITNIKLSREHLVSCASTFNKKNMRIAWNKTFPCISSRNGRRRSSFTITSAFRWLLDDYFPRQLPSSLLLLFLIKSTRNNHCWLLESLQRRPSFMSSESCLE